MTSSINDLGGTISGFDEIKVGSGDAAAKAPVRISLAEAIELVRNLQSDLDPQRLNTLQARMLEHVQNRSNPHRLTPEDIYLDLWSELFGRFVPGVPPESYPRFSMTPETFDLYPFKTVTMTSPVTYVDSTGRVNTSPAGKLPVDYCLGEPSLPIWEGRVNYFTNSAGNAAHVLLENSLRYPSMIAAPSLDATLTSQPTSTIRARTMGGMHGVLVDVSNAVAIGKTWTFSTHLASLLPTGYISLFDKDDNLLGKFDVETWKRVDFEDTLIHLHVLGNGWVRLGVEYTQAPLSSIRIVYHHEKDVYDYIGVGEYMFAIWLLQNERGAGMSPAIYTDGATVSRSGIQVVLERLPLETTGTLFLDTNTRSNESASFPLITAGNLGVVNVYGDRVQLVGNTSGVDEIVYALTEPEMGSVAWSRDISGIRLKVHGSDVVREDTGTISSAPLTSVTLHPAMGYFKGLVYYPSGERDAALEFITQNKALPR